MKDLYTGTKVTVFSRQLCFALPSPYTLKKLPFCITPSVSKEFLYFKRICI
jgi:hypothetical protein